MQSGISKGPQLIHGLVNPKTASDLQHGQSSSANYTE